MRKKISTNRINNIYFGWLTKKINSENRNRSLLEYLFNIDFYSIFPNDDNRAIDGEKLKEEFEYETHVPIDDIIDLPCSMLEMLVALAIRINDITYQFGEGDKIDIWFWIMVDNLGLKEGRTEENDRKINRFLERRYLPSGLGGLFPLKFVTTDQRKIEVWYQMHAYLKEKGF